MTESRSYSHLKALESESIYVIREAFYHFKNLALLWSIGKDSCVLLWLVRKAFLGHVPFPCVHVDTGFKLPEMIEFRDRMAKEWNIELIVSQNEKAIREGMTFPGGKLSRVDCCMALKRNPLRDIIEQKNYQAVMVGIRRDEEGTRAKERYFSPRDGELQWDFREQPPEFWGQFQTDFPPNTHLRVHPLLHWTELNVWEYIEAENIPVVDLYYSQNGRRYRSLGCAPCTGSVESEASNIREIIQELRQTRTSERSGRAQDKESEHAFEQLRVAGYM